MRARFAAWLTRLLYRRSVVSDRPRSRWYFATRYGTWAKVTNYARMNLDHWLRRTTVGGRPFAIRVEPASVCNLKCPLCPTGAGEVERERAAMTAQTLEAILDRCGSHALYAHLWVWGEPLLNKHLADLVAVCHRRGIGTEVSSHLSLPLSEERIDALVRSGLDWLIVSNDAASAPTYEKYRVGGRFDLVMRNMRAIVERRRALGSPTPLVEWQFVPLRHNEHEMREAERLAREIGVDGVRFKPARLDKTRNLTFQGLVPVDLARQWAPSDPALFHEIGPGRPSFLDVHCRFLWGTVTVYPDGSMAPCCETTAKADDVGNLFRQDFGSVWNGPTYVRARRVALGLADGPEDEATACQGCKVFRKPLARPDPARAGAGPQPARIPPG